MKLVIGLCLISAALASVDVLTRLQNGIFPGHLYKEDAEEEELSFKGDQTIGKHADTNVPQTSDRPAGDRLFVDGDKGEIDWNDIAGNIIQEFEQNDPQMKYEEYSKAKNVILFVGGGMGPSTISAARIYSMQSENIKLAFDSMPTLGISRTYATNAQVSDSASAATAILCGEKNKYSVVGLNQHVTKGDCNSTQENKLESFLKKAVIAGKWTGLVSTARVTHPTAASSYANAAHRDWETDLARDLMLSEFDDKTQCPDIAAQLVDEDINKQIRVILGGGRRSFMPNTENDPEYPLLTGERGDGRNLINAWLQQKEDQERASYVWNKEDFQDVDSENTDYLMGLFEPSHMQYELNKGDDVAGEPALSEMVEKAIAILNRSPNGFFLVVDGARIDHGHHSNQAVLALSETVALSKAMRLAQQLTNVEDTLVLATADHSNPLTIAGYPFINNDITGLARITPDIPIPMLDLKTYTTLSYANGPGFLDHRTDYDSSDYFGPIEDSDVKPRQRLTDNPDVGKKDYYYDAAIYTSSGTHAGEDVAVYASGPMSRMFTGTYEQNYIAHAMMYASCVGDYADRVGCDSLG